jgi:tRNA pseudouridine32 synthase / 23S rRNA pseudouridine746 synthase
LLPPIVDHFFTPFNAAINFYALPRKFTFLIGNKPHPLCQLAATELQFYLDNQKEWNHNFGLLAEQEGTIIGKMFGVLVVKNLQNEIGYLSAFSGKLAGGNHHAKFVPPVFDLLTDNSFLNNGMEELTRMNQQIKKLEEPKSAEDFEKIKQLKIERKNYSINLQKEIFEHYFFLNQAGEKKSLNEIFKNANYKNPPSGAGECAAPKLLQYAFLHQLKPIALAEFWWGQSPKSESWKHGQYYPSCKEKCGPIFVHMLAGFEVDGK